MHALPPGFVAAVAAELPADLLTYDDDERAEFGRDRTRVFMPDPSAIALPRSTAEVSRLLALCSEHRVGVVPSGGRTGLAGGAMACNGELVISLSRMRQIDPIDELGATVRVQAGAVTQAVHEAVAAHGLSWPVDFASKGSSQVGGNISTNAGGVRVIRWGGTRQWVLGLEVVLASGEVLTLNGALEKNNVGFDLRQLFIGSEGTLGIITGATLKLTRLPGHSDVLLFAVRDLAAVLALFRAARKAPFVIAAFEFFTDRCLARVQQHRKLRMPLTESSTHYVLLEAEGEAVGNFVEEALAAGLVTDGTLAQNRAQAADLWALRESISESLSATGVPHKSDIALPVAGLEAFCAEVDGLFMREYPGWDVCLFGHIGDGNLHVNVMKPGALSAAEFHARTAVADRDLFALVQKHHGSISAEHGIGLLKKPYLGYSLSPGEITLLKGIKKTLDPENILNPGKIFDL